MIETTQKSLKFVYKYKYIITILAFFIWIAFLDSSSWLYISKLKSEMVELEKEKEKLEAKSENNKNVLKSFENTKSLEKYAREEYYMRKQNEDVFVFKSTK